MSSIARTPAGAAQLGAAVDRPAPRLNSWQALGVILAVYALFFAGSDVYAIVNPPGGQIEDYANKQGIVILADVAAEIAAALAILYLICRWLASREDSRGSPGHGLPPSLAVIGVE